MNQVDVDLNQTTIPLKWIELFHRSAPTDVEIGSGKGRFMLDLARSEPGCNLLAVERAAKYHKLCCERAAKHGLVNVRVLRTSAEDLLFRLLAPGSVTSLYILFPDPWPKKRHHKRRLFTSATVAAMARALRPEGRLLVKSDHPDYAEVIRSALDSSPEFKAIDPGDAFAPLPLSGFERKYIEDGRQIHSFARERRAGPHSPTPAGDWK